MQPSRQSHPKGEECGDNFSFCLRFDPTRAFYMANAKSQGTGASKDERSDGSACREGATKESASSRSVLR